VQEARGVSTGIKLTIGGAIIACITTYMAYLGGRSSWQYYLTVDECTADAAGLLNRSLRVSGRIAEESLHIDSDRTSADFVLKGAEGELHVTCGGPLPDNLAERIEVVVEGRLESARELCGHKVITRCASKYESKCAHSPSADRMARREATP